MHSPLKPIRSERQLNRAGNAVTCANCGAPLRPKRSSRRQKFCDDACRKNAFRASKWLARYELPEAGRSVANNRARSMACNGPSVDGPPRIYGPRRVIQRELFAGRQWRDVVSPDGVRVWVAGLTAARSRA
jgi:hypothetical protein